MHAWNSWNGALKHDKARQGTTSNDKAWQNRNIIVVVLLWQFGGMANGSYWLGVGMRACDITVCWHDGWMDGMMDGWHSGGGGGGG